MGEVIILPATTGIIPVVLDRLIAKGSTTVVFLADNGKKLFEIESVPDSLAVRRGAIALAEGWAEDACE